MFAQQLAVARSQPSAYLATKLQKLRAQNGDPATIEAISTVLQERCPAPAKARRKASRPRRRKGPVTLLERHRVDGEDFDNLGDSPDY